MPFGIFAAAGIDFRARGIGGVRLAGKISGIAFGLTGMRWPFSEWAIFSIGELVSKRGFLAYLDVWWWWSDWSDADDDADDSDDAFVDDATECTELAQSSSSDLLWMVKMGKN